MYIPKMKRQWKPFCAMLTPFLIERLLEKLCKSEDTLLRITKADFAL